MFRAILVSITTLLITAGTTLAQNPDHLRWGLGLQGGTPLSGIAINYQTTQKLGLMGVVGVEDAPHFAFKPRFNFLQDRYVGVFGWGIAGIRDHIDEEIYLGGGAGVEFDWRGLSPELPPIGWSLEAGLTNFDLVVGLGIMWYF